MMKSLTIIIITSLISATVSAELNEPVTLPNDRIAAPSGLRMRSAPSLSAQKVCVIPYGEKVDIILQQGDEMTIEGTTGKWTRIFWNNQQGWVFGGHLSDINAVLTGKWKGTFFYLYLKEKDISTWGFIGGSVGSGTYSFDPVKNSIIFKNQHSTMRDSIINRFEIIKISYHRLELIAIESLRSGGVARKHKLSLKRIK